VIYYYLQNPTIVIFRDEVHLTVYLFIFYFNIYTKHLQNFQVFLLCLPTNICIYYY
jgi:hypothetical protein